jgi:hypothetical protein
MLEGKSRKGRFKIMKHEVSIVIKDGKINVICDDSIKINVIDLDKDNVDLDIDEIAHLID